MDPNAATIATPTVRSVSPGSVPRWLARGWQDFVDSGWPSFLHGLIVTVVSLIIVQITLFYWPLLPGAVSGFVLVGPILATGLYALSQCLERGETPTVKHAAMAWRKGTKCLMRFGVLLVLAGTAWVAFSALMFHLFVETAIDKPADFLRYVLVQSDALFLLWAVLGGLGAALSFALTVVTVPLLLDRDIDLPSAMMISVRAVGENPFTMLWWALVILVATGASIATLMLGFLVLYPVLGHASWHVYRDLVDATPIAARTLPE